MLVIDVPPEIPPQYAPVIVAEATQAQKPVTDQLTIGVCQLVSGKLDDANTAFNVMSPSMSAQTYFRSIGRWDIVKALDAGAKTTLLQGPGHGTVKEEWGGNYRYLPSGDTYSGPDQATILIEGTNFKIKLIYQFQVVSGVIGGTDGQDPYKDKKYCPNGGVWKISLNPDDPNAPIYTFEPA